MHLTAAGYDPDSGVIFAAREMEARPYFVGLDESKVVQHCSHVGKTDPRRSQQPRRGSRHVGRASAGAQRAGRAVA